MFCILPRKSTAAGGEERALLLCGAKYLVWLTFCLFHRVGKSGGSVANVAQCDAYLPQIGRGCVPYPPWFEVGAICREGTGILC